MCSKYLFPLIMLFCIVTASCEKEEGIALGTNYQCCSSTFLIDSPDMIDFKFLEGTYWKFHDSINGAQDSVVVSNVLTTNHYQNLNVYEVHNFSTTSYPSMESHSYRVWNAGTMKDYEEADIFSGVMVYERLDANYPITSTEHSSMFIYNQHYTNVMEIEVDIDSTENGDKSIYFCNAEFGFLKHEVYSGTTLIKNKVLIDKNIVR